MAKTYNVFISHSWAYIQDLKNLRTLLEERGYFNVEFEEATPDEPIDSENAEYIKRRLREKIKNSDIVLGIAGVYASYSEWIEWELDTAIKNDIPIIGVIPRGQERISTIVSSRSKEDIRWNTESIVSAIKRWAN
ncbi:MAG: TIR domain-containing protein [Candidatus Cloacimonadales bacterium]|nr:TIR domain-containing protein [Candidatus Cloacimonadales bacterium]